MTRSRRAAVAAALCALFPGCTPRAATPQPDAAAPVVSTSPPAAPAVTTSAAPARSRSQQPSMSALPRAFAALGEPCAADTDKIMCGSDGRIAGIRVPVDHALDGAPPQAENIRHESPDEPARRHGLDVAVEGERLWIRLVTCGTCRRIMGSAFVGDLPRLSAAQLKLVQRLVGVPDDKPLQTAADWRAHYRSLPITK